ncbi:hypothetical protein KC332_g8743 [Hortaea werneckii]|nr:hypothetical protein KC358_g7800 [Hortaea werneckii]KAI6831736.1 hypothetical protein KC350_g7292 [Hortaea werneckii]KAI6927870.1 hypothetical protein KC348_g8268 [Hortaea werneckii]KAI6934370.1 hypothetical protein KC341_g7658 [Hortaea werneckii]KAI6969035.1 hypothetical protein KC321_g8120 [Hortaea werneckii]
MDENHWQTSFNSDGFEHQFPMVDQPFESNDDTNIFARFDHPYGRDDPAVEDLTVQRPGTQVNVQEILPFTKRLDEPPRPFHANPQTSFQTQQVPLQYSYLDGQSSLTSAGGLQLGGPYEDSRSSFSKDSGFFSGSPGDSQQFYGIHQGAHDHPDLVQTLDGPGYTDDGYSVRSDPTANRGTAARVGGRLGRTKQTFACNLCGKELKSLSEASKHRSQHTRPHRCSEPYCKRTQGFATNNDLERHRKSVHGKTPTVGMKKGYVCKACPPVPEGHKVKFWPRRDNFKAHAVRKHVSDKNKEVLDELLAVSETERPPDAVDAGPESVCDPAYSGEYNGQQASYEMPSPMTVLSATPDLLQQGNYSSTNNIENAIAGIGIQLAGISSIEDELCSGFDGASTTLGADLPNASTTATDLSMYTRPRPVVTKVSGLQSPPMPKLELSSSGVCPTSDVDGVEWPQPPDRSLVARSAHKLHQSPHRQSVGQNCKHSDGDFICDEPGCGKRKKRECDLRKHRKRHSRPYGCTFADCWKRFGSRNDWKRHENSQHFLIDQWRCDMIIEGNHKCGSLFQSDDAMRKHLIAQHTRALQLEASRKGNPLQRLVTLKAEHMHIGREAHHFYWCGFCDRLIAPVKEAPNAWEDRFRHVGDHYDKENKHVDDWICVQANRRKGDISKPDRRKGKGSSEVKNDLDSDVDLEDAGIPNASPVSTDGSVVGFTPPSSRSQVRKPNKRQRIDEGVDVDAEHVSDHEWGLGSLSKGAEWK